MRVLTQIDVALQRVFDWRHDAALRDLLTSSASYAFTQRLASEASNAGAQAVIVPSATGIDANVIIFVDNAGEGTHIEVVKQITDLRPIMAALSGGS